jgi:hypothetical protein
MMLHEAQIGRNGQRPETSAISGYALAPEDVYMPLGDVIIGVKAREWREMEPKEQARHRTAWLRETATVQGEAEMEDVTAPRKKSKQVVEETSMETPLTEADSFTKVS